MQDGYFRGDLQLSPLGEPKPAWARLWHVWAVVVPRRSITGRLVWGRVWRRHNGRHWQYKKMVRTGLDSE